MKRIKLATNQFLSLYRTETDAGQITSFELYRDQTYGRVPFIAAFSSTRKTQAFIAWEVCSDALRISPTLTNRKLRIIIDRSSDLAARTAPLEKAQLSRGQKKRMRYHKRTD